MVAGLSFRHTIVDDMRGVCPTKRERGLVVHTAVGFAV